MAISTACSAAANHSNSVGPIPIRLWIVNIWYRCHPAGYCTAAEICMGGRGERRCSRMRRTATGRAGLLRQRVTAPTCWHLWCIALHIITSPCRGINTTSWRRLFAFCNNVKLMLQDVHPAFAPTTEYAFFQHTFFMQLHAIWISFFKNNQIRQ